MNKFWKWKIGRIAYGPSVVSADGWREILPGWNAGLFWNVRFRANDVIQIDPTRHDKFGGCLLIVDQMVAKNARVMGTVIAPSTEGPCSLLGEFPSQWCRKVGRARWSVLAKEKPPRV